jgi:RecA/RadA recombinase
MTKKENLKFLETGCEKVDEILGGGVPLGIVTAVFGEPTSGKTQFGNQCSLSNIKNIGKKTIIIETEGLRDYDRKVLLYKFMKRWDLTKEDVDKNIVIKHTMGDIQLQSVQKLLQMFGYMVTFEISKNGKYSVKFQNCTPTLTEKTLKDTSLIILDSLTKPIKDSVGSETQNLPARAQLVERLFGKLYHVAKIYNIGVVVIHHASVNPMMPFGRDLGKPYGGNPVLYNSKYALEFIDATNKVKNETGWGEEARRVKLLRRPDEPSTGELFPVRLKKDWGFCDE